MDLVTEPASLSRRINAATIDTIAIVTLGFALPQLAELILRVPGRVQLAWFSALLFLLEPVLLRGFGSTVGQRILGLRVLPARPNQPLTFLRLALRYWCKLVLGAPSMLYILFSHQSLALHDKPFGTVVLRVPRGAQAPLTAPAPTPMPIPDMPSAPRRFAAFIVWLIAASWLWVSSSGSAASHSS